MTSPPAVTRPRARDRARDRGPSISELAALAQRLADLSDKAILPFFRRPIDVDNKGGAGPFDPVTAADRAAERVIARALKREHPDHGIVGEEYGAQAGAGRYNWVIDPIDGTKAFILGSPLWGTLIGLLDEGAPVLGLMSQPFTRERIWSGPKGAFWRVGEARARRIETRACRRLGDAVLSTTSPELLGGDGNRARFAALAARVRMTRYGGDCYHYALVASGGIDVVVESGLKAHDVVALIPIIEQAGGIVTTWAGGPAHDGGSIIAAGDRRIHAEAMAVLAG